jgi:hypothetical protein
MSSSNSRTRSDNSSSRISLPAFNSDNNKINLRSVASATTMTTSLPHFKDQISNEVPQNRRQEIYEYFKIFGYKPDNTIIQVHITGFFRKKTYSQREIEQHKAAVNRYGATTFTIIGRTHDPSIMDILIKPKKKNPYESSPGYVGYLWRNKDTKKRAPHELVPIDFTPVHLPYPVDWKERFATKGFMIALHVPSSLAKTKNRVTRALYRIGKTRVDVKQEWKFLYELKNISYSDDDTVHVTNTSGTIRSRNKNVKSKQGKIDNPLDVLKLRLAKREITMHDYNNLYNALST